MRSFRLEHSDHAPFTVLCIGAHCDDIEIGCGGFLVELCGALPAVDIEWFIAAAPERRTSESRRAAARLLKAARAHHIEAHDFTDGELPYAGPALRRSMRAFAERHRADLVLTHFRDDAHQDHRFLAELTWQTFRDHLIWEYEIPKYDGDLARPNWFVPLEASTAELKIECLLECFPSQREKPWFGAETFRGLMRLRGTECRSPSGYAEAFHLRKGLLQLPAITGRPAAGASRSPSTPST